jgi:hypothetical protein
MSLPVAGLRLPLHHVFHPSDFSQASEVAFAHALKLAVIDIPVGPTAKVRSREAAAKLASTASRTASPWYK